MKKIIAASLLCGAFTCSLQANNNAAAPNTTTPPATSGSYTLPTPNGSPNLNAPATPLENGSNPSVTPSNSAGHPQPLGRQASRNNENQISLNNDGKVPMDENVNVPGRVVTEKGEATPIEKKNPNDQAKTDIDAQINNKIRSQITGWFTDNFKDIALITSDGVVVIEGYVYSPSDQTTLNNETKKIEGVKSVVNKTQVIKK